MEQSINDLMKNLQEKTEKVIAGGGKKESRHSMTKEN